MLRSFRRLRSLRTRVVLLALGTVVTALLSVALLSRLAVRRTTLRVARAAAATSLSGLVPLLEGATDAERGARLLRAGESLGSRFLLIGPDGSVRAASTPRLRDAEVRVLGERLEVEEREARDGKLVARRTVLVGAPRAALADGGVLYALPAAEAESSFSSLAGLDRALLGAALVAGVLALLLAWLLARGIVRPVEALTEAARRMGAGELAVRVPVSGGGELAELGSAFNAMADARGKADRLRQALVADVAHELRTPLTNLRCQIEAIEDGLKPADEAAFRSLHEETLLLARLVDDLQELALAEAGALSLRLERIAVSGVVEAALAGIAPLAAARGVSLSHGGGGLTVDADPERLGQVLRNLLANAVAHTPAGGSVRVEAAGCDGDVAITVADTGEGIAPEHLPHVFERFYRADPSRARATGGAGLGLAIVRQLVQAQGGSVSAESEPGRGARFTVRLPRAE